MDLLFWKFTHKIKKRGFDLLQQGPWNQRFLANRPLAGFGKGNREGWPDPGEVGRRRRGEGGQGGKVGQGEPVDGVWVKDCGLDGARRR